jgi:hypothetical protein
VTYNRKISKAPWTKGEVELLEKRQDDTRKHPYTCICHHSLIPTKTGWECEECGYVQDWCFIEDIAASLKQQR